MYDRQMFWPVNKLVVGLTLLLLCVAGSALGGTISGTVTDITSGEGLLGATVTVIPNDESVDWMQQAAKNDGAFEFKNVPAGEYTVNISFMGFLAKSYQVSFESESASETIDAGLKPNLLNFGVISVTASRTPEKTVDAPASVSVVNSEDIQERITLTPTDHIKGLPAVDVASTGLNQSNAVVRGFNNIFSGGLLVLVDDRIARVPSLRFNAYNFISTPNSDIDRIEIVSGPGSALYGPNTANGVMHMITKSPFESQGTTISLGGGERSLGIGSIRHAGSYQDRIGYKISAQYYQGNDWESSEPTEPDTLQLVRLTTSGEETVGSPIANNRNFDIERIAADARVDFLVNEDLSLRVNGGFNRASSIELTGLGAGQAIDWTYNYYQARMKYKDLFIQGFVNMSDAGDTYLLTSGRMIVDKSKLWVAQMQHRYSPSESINLTYGVDAIYTRPNTEGSINGRHEDDDDIDEVGAYLQSDMKLNDKFKLIAAARIDDNNRLKDLVFSPRAALVYQPNSSQNFRATYNRAYSTPDNNNLFLDILQKPDVYGIGAGFSESLGYEPNIDLRVQGVPESGFTWRMTDAGPSFRSPFAPLAGLTTSDFIDFNDPAFTNVMWTVGRGAVLANVPPALQAAVALVAPPTVTGVNNTLMTLDPDIGSLVPSTVNDIADIDRLEPTITNTFELGYKGDLGNRFSFSFDAYRTDKDNFIGPLTVETPNVLLDPATLAAYLGPQFAASYAAASPTTQGTLLLLDEVSAGGNGNGTPVDELTAMFTSGAASIPFGTVSPEQAYVPDAVLVTYRNFGDVSFYGADFAFAYHLHRSWDLGGSYSYVSKNFFEKNEDQVHDINLNAPQHKFALSLRWSHSEHGLTAQARYRWVDAFEMDSPFFGSVVESYRILDLNVGMRLLETTRLSLTIQNLLDDKHIEFVGGPELGRLAIVRITQTF